MKNIYKYKFKIITYSNLLQFKTSQSLIQVKNRVASQKKIKSGFVILLAILLFGLFITLIVFYTLLKTK